MSASGHGAGRDDLWQEILGRVQKPSRYIGGEWNEIVKDHRSVDVTLALAFPDVYEIGMSHLGLRILYSLLNAREDVAAERVYCPWPDMADTLRRRSLPLATLETGTPVRDMDVVGFSLQYELGFTNVLEMLDLAGIPLRSADRSEDDPLVIAGGPAVFNIEPMADFLDLVFIGDGEAMLPEFVEKLADLRRSRATRREMIRELAGIQGIYAPSLYGVETEAGSGLLVPVPEHEGAPYPVRRNIMMDFRRHPYPDRIVMPHGEIVHDRVSVEIMRGCPVGCRFCQAGYIYRPTRERDPSEVLETVLRSVDATGYDEFSLASLNTGEYDAIEPLICTLMDRLASRRVSVSLASMHASTITETLAREVRRVRKSGFTIAPEAGSQRLRNVINKNLDEEQILDASRLAFEAGWQKIKLYFMIGLPTETDEDVEAQADLAHRILSLGRRTVKRGRLEVTLSASSFVPKPVTPFQWCGMDRIENLYRKQDILASRVRKGVRFKHHECETSFLEAVFSRGDRRLGPVLENAWRNGARFDGWSEHFSLKTWEDAFREEGVDPAALAYADLPTDGRLPWDVIDPGVNSKWLARELDRARSGETIPVCGPEECHACAPFAADCMQGVVAETTGKPLTVDRAAPSPAGEGDDETREGPVYRYRVRFVKQGRLRFLGHLDLTRAIGRALRRAGVPLRYSSGFNPKPRISFGPALAVGTASDGEYLDFETVRRLEAEEILESVNRSIQDDLRFLAVSEIRRDVPSLGDSISAARYLARTPGGDDARAAVESFRARGPVRVVREGRKGTLTFDLDREVLDLQDIGPEAVRFVLAVNTGKASVRPGELLTELFGDRAGGMTTTREELLVELGERRVNPLLAASVVRNHERTVR